MNVLYVGQYIVALPASLELWLLQDRPVAACLLILVQVRMKQFAKKTFTQRKFAAIIEEAIPWRSKIKGHLFIFGGRGWIY